MKKDELQMISSHMTYVNEAILHHVLLRSRRGEPTGGGEQRWICNG